ncbi:MAG: endonuclease MutS2 [bacterium]|nr:endonuclease MutS2 [bacterium]
MHISDHTLKTLEFDKIRAHISERTTSKLGREEIDALLPTDDPALIEARLRPTLEALDLISFDDAISLGSLPDIRNALQTVRVPGAILSIPDLLDVYDILQNARHLLAYFEKRQEKYPHLRELTSGLHKHPDLEHELQSALDPATQTVKDAASPDLRRIRRSIEQTRTDIRNRVESVLSKLPDSVVQDRLVTLRGGRFVIPIRENQKHKMDGLIHDQSASGATVFVEPVATVELNNHLRQLEGAEEREIKRILAELTAAVAAVSNSLRDSLDILGQFDAIYARASFAQDLNCTEPLFNQQSHVQLRGARHPLLVYRLRNQEQTEPMVPLDLELGTDTFHTLVLTGPNAGGKTVALKTLGLLALLAQAGLPIPAQPKSELPIFSGVFADIGDAQSIENDLSTFSSHAANLVEICNCADRGALILLDEVGASTDPDQGSALAMALLTELTKRGCRTVATTHHGALKAFAHNESGIANGSMAFDAQTLSPTYQLRLHLPGSSYAFEIARRLGMPDHIIAHATAIAGSDTGRVEALITELDDTYRRYREELEQIEADQKTTSLLKADLETRLEQVERRERALKRSAQEEAQRILDGANTLIENTVSELRRRNADRTSIKQAHEQVNLARTELKQILQDTEPDTPVPHLNPGDPVWVRSFEKEGTVISTRENRAMVEVGKVRLELDLTDLEIRSSKDKPQPAVQVRTRPSRDVSAEVDLRGHTVDEALEAVDKYLDELSLARLDRATIIHGKGTGTLRKAVSQHLKENPLIKSQRLGNHTEGGTGVTVVTLNLDQ